MHTRTPFVVTDETRILAALRRFGFATVISADDSGRPFASRLATVLRRGRDGRVRLWTHIDRRNPQLETLRPERELLLVAYGPDAYVSPQWYARQPSVPSWNYIAVHVRGRPRLFPDSRPELIETLLYETVAEYESRRSTPWPYNPDEKFHNGLARAVAGFEIEIDEIEAAFKLSQDKPELDRLSVIAALATSEDSTCRSIGRLMADELDGVGAFAPGCDDIPDAPNILLADEGEHSDAAQAL